MSSFLSILFSPSSTSTTGTHPSTNSSTDPTNDSSMRQCWICFAEEPIESIEVDKWVQPCKCHGTTAWVHQGCLLDWMDVKVRAGHSLTSPIACPQCHQPYRVVDSWSLPRPILLLLSGANRAIDRFLLYSALGGLAGTAYGWLWGYGAAAFTATYGPTHALSFFQHHTQSLTAESVVKVLLGMPLVTVSVLSAVFPSLTWAFPLIPPILYANDVIEWAAWPPHPKLIGLALPFALFAYRFGEYLVPKMILRKQSSSVPASSASSLLLPSTPSPQNGRDEEEDAINVEDERAIRVSVLSTTSVLMFPFLSAITGYALSPFISHPRLHPIHHTVIGGMTIMVVRDILRSLGWYQRVVIRPYRRILPFKD